MNDIERWLAKGFIDEATAQVLAGDLDEEKAKRRKITAQVVLYTIGVILLGTGVVCFVSANDWLLELLKRQSVLQILILLAAALISLIGGTKLGYENKTFPRFGNALIFLSTLLIGAAYIRIEQAYNWNDNSSATSILWLISVLPLAFIFKSTPVNWLSIILFMIAFPSVYYNWQIDSGEVWTVFIPLCLGGILYSFANIPFIRNKYGDFSLQYKISASIPVFFTFLIMVFSTEESYYLPDIHYVTLPAILFFINLWNFFKQKAYTEKTESAFLTVLMLFLLILLSISNVNATVIMIWAHLFLISLITSILYWGYRLERMSLINVGNVFLVIYLFSVYCRYGWNYLDKALFFIIGGMILTGTGIFLEKNKKRIEK